MRRVEFKGKQYQFPANATDDQIRTALQSVSTASESIAKPDGAKPAGSLVKLNDDQSRFIDTIRTIESGGLENPSIRTKVNGSSSTAYGSYQITKTLINDYQERNPGIFTEEEQTAMGKLAERQEVAIAIGGRDRPSYEKGGANHAQAQAWAEQFGYETVKEFLDAFDYGGDYGLTGDIQFQLDYENFARKMLLDHLNQEGDAVKAAARWHGGANWQRSGHKNKTKQYINKFKSKYSQ